MNRKEEYTALLDELEALDAPDAVEHALRRDRRRKRTVRPLFAVLLVLCCFVAAVNLSETVAYACGRVPVLRELAAAVCFSRSLSDAVKNEYVQPVRLSQSGNGVTARVEYLIVDQRQVNVFFRLESKEHTHLWPEVEVFAEDGSRMKGCSTWFNQYGAKNGELQSVTLDFLERDVPERLTLRLALRDLGAWQADAVLPAPAEETSIWDESREDREPEPVAEFDFSLEFDPWFTEQGRHIPGGQTVVLDGHTLHIAGIDIYPSHLTLRVEGDPANTAWLERLSFYLVTDQGERFDPPTNGVVAIGSPDTPETVQYRADSTYFYKAERITIYFTYAEWLEKDRERVHLDLANAQADFLPEGAALAGVEREGDRWIISLQIAEGSGQALMNTYYDPAGEEHSFTTWVWKTSQLDENGNELVAEGTSLEQFPLNDYPFDEVWLTPRYTKLWQAEEPVAVTVELQ